MSTPDLTAFNHTMLYERISAFISSFPHGWCTQDKAKRLADIVLDRKPEICVEIGVWAGKSAIPIAMALQAVGHGKLIAIDPWNAADSVLGQPKDHAEWWKNTDHEDAYRIFKQAMWAHGLGYYFEIQRSKSDDVAPPKNIGLLHIDGNHAEQAVKDVERFALNVKIGGVVFMDDLQWEGGSVVRACDKLKTMGFKQLLDIDMGEGAICQVLERVK